MKLNVSLLHQKMVQNQFVPIQSNLQEMILYGRKMEEHMYVCCMMRPTEKWQITHEQLKDIAFQIERKFLFQGCNQVDFLYIVLSENIEEDRKLIGEGYQMWLVNVYANQVMIFENQPDTFLQLEDILHQFLQEQETQNKDKIRNLPFVTIALIVINVLIFIVMECFGSTYDTGYMIQWGAADDNLIMENHQYYRLFTCMFLHFGFEHLLSNMITLYFFGSVVEKHMSKLKYLLFYLISGVAGSLISVIYYYYMLGGNNVSAGASGAIFGVIGMLVGMVCVSKGKFEGLSVQQVVIMSILVLYTGMRDESVNVVAHGGGFVAGILMGAINWLRIRKN